MKNTNNNQPDSNGVTFVLSLTAGLLGMSLMSPAYGQNEAYQSADAVIWQAITFGQSTDLNFASTILPEKIGTNEVLVNGVPVQAGPLAQDFTMESRGGKLANSHEGMTFYYTKLSTKKNFTLSADITVEQIGPETDALPNLQEGAGLMVRDIIGKPRANPQPEGHEEFPAASNMAFNQIRTYKYSDASQIQLSTSFREGIYQPWGTSGNKRTVKPYAENLLVGQQYHLTLSRNNVGFSVSYTAADGTTTTKEIQGANANIVQMIDPDYQYVGFAVSRNVKIHVTDATLNIDPEEAQTVDAPKFVAKAKPLRVEMSSPSKTAQRDYTLQARANYSGLFSVTQDGVRVVNDQPVAAGDMFAFNTTIPKQGSQFEIDYVGTEKNMLQTAHQSLKVTRHDLINPNVIFVSPEGQESGFGSASDPLSLEAALQLVAPGGSIYLMDGEYKSARLPTSVSGSEGALKHLIASGQHVVFSGSFSHDASYWYLKGMEVNNALLRIKGSHNIFEYMVVHDSPDTGFQISSGDSGRALWASDNLVRYVESYNNMDSSRINADGFAAKMRVGDGNVFDHCISHHNIDDGWDLFNKVEDGANGVVTIRNSISYSNGRTLDDNNSGNTIGNGFKLGGEGLPVAHILENNLSYKNNMDGVTDNFNSGSLKIKHILSVDNARFNFLIRQSPYDDSAASERTFDDNLSVRVNRTSRYNDVVHAHHMQNNWLFSDGKTSNSSGETLDQGFMAAIQSAVALDDGTPSGERRAAIALQQINLYVPR